MTVLAGIALEVATAAPVAFVLGILVGLGLAGRYRIVRRNGANGVRR